MELELPDDTESLKAMVRRLLVEIEQLKAKNAELEAKNAELRSRLDQDSGNSHKPPSTDGLTKKPALPKTKRSNSGGQKGHKGNTLRQVSEPDHIICHYPEVCSCCGKAFHYEQIEIMSKRQVFDLPPQRLIVTEHQLGQAICDCGHTETGTYPSHITQPAQYGAKVRALGVLLSVQYRLPQEQISQLFIDLYGYSLNTGTVIHALDTAYTQLQSTETHIKNQLLQEKVVHYDETGLRVAGKTHWLHTACSAQYTYLFVHPKRGQEALRSASSIIKDFQHYAVHDCWASYFAFTCFHVICNAHILRELTALIEQGSVWASLFHTFLLDCYQQNIAKESVEVRFSEIMIQANREEPFARKIPQARGRPKKTKGRSLLERLIHYKVSLLAFMFDSDIPFTNNQAERDIRCVKIKMKVSGGFRTTQGAHAYARIQSVISTLRKQNINVFDSLCILFSESTSDLLCLTAK
ncbi:MAG TPA: IS66 family transposase [Fervidobacterium sp.]|nr:MAG: IS66 family transposase [Candidatus Competibacteraceae bacterium]HUM44929.1 IS66 family transposase [Fervidobacterium sp.]